MGSQFLDHVRRNTRKNGALQITSKSVLLLLAIVSMAASGIYWWGVQSELTTSRPIAIAFTAILVLAPPTLISFLIPWSPAGMLLQRVNAQTYGHAVVVFASIYLVYYSFQLQYAWWAAQRATAESGLIWQQVGIGLIGFILIPALLWAPVSSEELTAQVEQAHIVKRYELQAQADIAILRATLLRAQEKALIGFANLTVDEREELAGVMRSLVGGIDKTLREVGETVHKVSGAQLPFSGMLDDNDDIRDVLDYIGESLASPILRVDEDRSVKLPAREYAHVDPHDEPRQLYDAFQRTPPDSTPSPSGRAEAAPTVHTKPHQTARGTDPLSQRDESRSRWQDRPDGARYVSDARDADRPGSSQTIPHDGEYTIAHRKYGGDGWTVKQLALTLGIEPETARKRMREWEQAGLVTGRGQSNGNYRFTESGGT